MTRDELIETMARAIYPEMFAHSDYAEVPYAEAMSRPRYVFLKEQTIRAATTALTAIEAAGMRVVPVGEPKRPRNIPAVWEVGHRVRYVRDTGDWGPTRNTVGTIVEIRKDDIGKPASHYQVFWVCPDSDKKRTTRFWTTPDDVELLAAAQEDGQ